MANSKHFKTPKEVDLLEGYLQEAQTWEADKMLMLRQSEKRAWRVAYAAGGLAACAVLAVAMLAPLKEAFPFLVRVDNTTGIVDIVSEIKNAKTNYDEVLNTYFLSRYVLYREAYSYSLAADYYVNVGAMSAPDEQQRYFASFNPKNPDSPLNVYGRKANIKIKINSTSFIKPDLALVRWQRIEEHPGDKPLMTHWASTIAFKYTGAPMKKSDREVNPLGFQAINYRKDADSSVETRLPAADQLQPTTSQTASQQAGLVVLFPGQTVMPDAQAGSATQTDGAPPSDDTGQ